MQLHNNDTASIADEALGGLKSHADKLISSIQQNDLAGAMESIKRINALKEQSIFKALGEMASGLRKALADLDQSLPGAGDIQETDGAKIAHGLTKIIQLTHDASSKTLDMVDNGIPSASSIAEDSRNFRKQIDKVLATSKMDPGTAALLTEVNAHLESTESKAEQLGDGLRTILMSQNYQDLTSQALQKIIAIIQTVEKNLSTLISYANLVQQAIRLSENPEEAHNIQKRDELAHSLEGLSEDSDILDQGDVDELLNSLGF